MTNRLALAIAVLSLVVGARALAVQAVHEAPSDAPTSGRVTPSGEPGAPLHVSGTVAGADGAAVAGASLYIYQTDAEGYYGVKPVSDNKNPRLKLFLRSGPRGEWAFDTIRPGSYPNSRIPAHIHFEVSAPGFAAKIFEIVFEGDPFITADQRKNPAFSVRPVSADGHVTDRILLERAR